MEENEVRHLLDECNRIYGDCLYTSQTHFVMARKAQIIARCLIIIPSGLAVMLSLISAFAEVGELSIIAAFMAGIAGLSSTLGITRDEQEHNNAANVLTALRHEAKSMKDAMWKEIDRSQLHSEVSRLGDKYRVLCTALPVTDDKSYKKAKTRIEEGNFD
ncbi:MAG TPA: SLATT domain-containing protein [Bacteroidetes bacterium]|nr:hypothetical protein BMS3Bbin04_00866 [bacterium BMS3Bbin04]HDO65754.1 SLATT domain-containing protein [Bacteroidota bacterium]HEX04879.1 SLATT domain-containing protein [Bacteroidota bacterium]